MLPSPLYVLYINTRTETSRLISILLAEVVKFVNHKRETQRDKEQKNNFNEYKLLSTLMPLYQWFSRNLYAFSHVSHLTHVCASFLSVLVKLHAFKWFLSCRNILMVPKVPFLTEAISPLMYLYGLFTG